MAINIQSEPDNHHPAYDRSIYYEVESNQAAKDNFKFKVELLIATVSQITIYLPPTSIDGGNAYLEFHPSDVLKRYFDETQARSMAEGMIYNELRGWKLHRFRFTEVYTGTGTPATVSSTEMYCHNSIQDFDTSTTKRSVVLSRDVNEVFPRDSARQLSFFIDPILIGWYFIKATIYRTGGASSVKYLKGAGGNELLETPASGRVVAVFDDETLGLTSTSIGFMIEAVLGYSSPGVITPVGTVGVIGSVAPGSDPKTALFTTNAAHGFTAGQFVVFTYEADDEEESPIEGYFQILSVPEDDEFTINFEGTIIGDGVLRVQALPAFDAPESGEVNASATYKISNLCHEEILFKNRLGGWDVQAFRYVKDAAIQTRRNTGRTSDGYMVTAREGYKRRTLGGVFIDNQEKVIDLLTSAAVKDMELNDLAMMNESATLEQLNGLVDLEITVQDKYLTING
jgi:hypothetical protein